MKSIQTKLTVTILLIFLVALSVLGGLNYWRARAIITGSITADTALQAENSAGDIGDWLEARKGELMLLAATPVIQGGDKAAIIPFLARAAKTNEIYDGISYAGPDGSYVHSSGITGSLADRDYFQQAVRGETVISDPLVSKNTGHLVTVVAMPVKVDGRINGVVTMAVNMDRLSQKILSIKVGDTGHAFVTQGDGLMIIHPNKEYVAKYNPAKDANADPGEKEVTARMIKAEKGIAQHTVQGVDKYYAYAPVPGVKWSMGITVPVAEVTGTVSQLTTITLVTILVVLLLTAGIFTWYARRLVRPLVVLEAAANRIADGDITVARIDIDSNDEIGRLSGAFEKMTRNLRAIITTVSQATEQVSASSEQLTASAEQSAQAANQVAIVIGEVADGAGKQLKAVVEAKTVVSQMSDGIRQVAANANTVADTSGRSAAAAQEGSQAVEKAIRQMGQIEKKVTGSAVVVGRLGERSKEIGQIVDTISGIAGQTNLLALNAAIEAARAGEQGRGFAVVAEEVRKLAEQSQEAAKQIADLINSIQQDTDKAVVAMNEGTDEVRVGTAVVNEAGQTFREIFNAFNEVTRQIRDISSAIQQMAGGSQQIVSAMQAIDGISKETASQSETVSAATEQQSATMEEIASSSQALAKLAEELTMAVNKFRI